MVPIFKSWPIRLQVLAAIGGADVDGVQGTSSQVRKVQQRIQAKNWQWRRIISRLFNVSFDKAEKDIAQSKLLKHWCERSICTGWAPWQRSGSSTWSRRNRGKGGTTDDDGLENINRKKRATISRSEIEQHKVMARQECLAFVGSPGQSSVKRRKMLTLSRLVQCVHYKTNREP